MEIMPEATGSLSIKYGKTYYSICFRQNGSVAAELVQYLEDVYRSVPVEVGILKLLGYTLQITPDPPPRSADHWVEVDLNRKVLSSNSELIKNAVTRPPHAVDQPYGPLTLQRIFQVLDARDFTVELF